MTVGDENVMEDLKIEEDNLYPVTLKVKVMDNGRTDVIGGTFVLSQQTIEGMIKYQQRSLFTLSRGSKDYS